MAAPGQWIKGTYQQMPYFVLLPENYDDTVKYPIILFLHQYQNHSGQPGQTDPWFNTPDFRSNHPCIVVVPLCVIGSQTSTPTFNWGGVTVDLQQPIVYALAILDLVITQYNADRNRQMLTGNSMGGLGAWGVLCNQGQRERFCAVMPVYGSCYYQFGNEAQVAAALRTFPIWSCHGGKDSQVKPDFDQAMFRAMQQIGGAMRFTGDPNGQHDTWDTFYADPATWNWLFAQRKGGSQLAASVDRTVVMAGRTDAIIDNAGNAWTITPGAQVAVNGNTDTSTSNVIELAWISGSVWQCNAALRWYFKTNAADRWSSGTSINPLDGSGAAFRVSNGKIIDPDGNPWVAAGLNSGGMNTWPMTPAIADGFLAMFPGISFLRIPSGNSEDPAAFDGFMRKMEAARVVCLIEYHPWPLKPAQTGADLAAQAASAGRWATYYKNRPYIWIGSMNEPQSGAMTPEHQAVYSAVRAADPNKMVVFVCGIGGGNPGATGAKVLNTAAYTSMKNIVWDLHFYGWATKYSTDQNACNAALTGAVASASGIAAAKGVTSADGIVPVIIGEFGPSTSGASLDANATQIIRAVLNAVGTGQAEGYAGWSWGADPFNALQVNNQPTAWGKQLAAGIAATAGRKPPPPPGPTLAELVGQLNSLITVLTSVAGNLGKLVT